MFITSTLEKTYNTKTLIYHFPVTLIQLIMYPPLVLVIKPQKNGNKIFFPSSSTLNSPSAHHPRSRIIAKRHEATRKLTLPRTQRRRPYFSRYILRYPSRPYTYTPIHAHQHLMSKRYRERECTLYIRKYLALFLVFFLCTCNKAFPREGREAYRPMEKRARKILPAPST